MRRSWIIGLAALWSGAGQAQTRELCPDRPGLGSPPCTVAPGAALVEVGLVDWTRSDDGAERSDSFAFADTLVRVGVSETVELQFGWTPYGHDHVRERASGEVTRAGRVGDALLGAKVNLASPDGSGFSAAAQAQATLPVGRAPISAGDWGVTVVVPLSYDLSGGVQLQALPQVEAAVDEDGAGRHLAWGATAGLGIDLSDAVGGAIEMQLIRDDDPAGPTTQARAGVSLGWQPSADWQWDAGANLGLNRSSDDLELYIGISRRF